MAMPDYSLADIAAATGGGNGDGFGGDNGAWWLLVLFALLGGFGRGGYGAQGGGGAGSVGGNEIYPWLNQAEVTSNGFQSLSTQLCNCCGDMQTALANGFGGVNLGVSNGFNQAEIAANQRQMANMQQVFGLSQQFSDCCCENRLATANLTSTILAENCADRAALSDGVRDIIQSQQAGTQRIIDQLCQDKIDAKNDEIAQLRSQVTALNLAASQGAQTAQLLADNSRQTAMLEQYLNPTPIPAYVVQNPNCCQNAYGTGCGCGM